MTFLVQLTGVGLYTGMSILGAFGEIEHFPSTRKLVGFAGLVARVHATGDVYYTGKITKKGRRELRTALIASAWMALYGGRIIGDLFSPIWPNELENTKQSRRSLVDCW